jgi:hypothetical protein
VTFLWTFARIGIVAGLVAFGLNALPAASSYDTGVLTIPPVVWDPIVAVLSLNRLLPISALIAIAAALVAIEAAMAAMWLGGWLMKSLFPS